MNRARSTPRSGSTADRTAHRMWTAAHLDTFRRDYPAGSVERVAFFLMLHLGLQPREIVAFRPMDIPRATPSVIHPELAVELSMYTEPGVPYVWQALQEASTIKLIKLVLDAAASFAGAPTCTPASLSQLRAERMPADLAALLADSEAAAPDTPLPGSTSHPLDGLLPATDPASTDELRLSHLPEAIAELLLDGKPASAENLPPEVHKSRKKGG